MVVARLDLGLFWQNLNPAHSDMNNIFGEPPLAGTYGRCDDSEKQDGSVFPKRHLKDLGEPWTFGREDLFNPFQG